ncbi:TIGR01777 family oxidoreductase [Marinifilum caeruleilacunae]|uniref:TIGR01777 family protein n=1 Tax=Marinifilum caeruleilacunae TaxID=2499076 RepID=A0ABX1WV92_9BACT|nr:TIGR01777 family oxidoreductase [Marinifilum caeruleilacunae]NOU60025.1 TIGR01777 family protein [Marinifilum caeruleilacunae]
MKIALSGSNGLVGSHLCDFLKHECDADIIKIPRELLYGDASLLANKLLGADVIIHLSGASILSRWTPKNKQILRDSRVVTTRNLCKAVNLMQQKPKQFICTSAVGIYNNNEQHTENSKAYSDDFLGQICMEWEESAMQMQELNVATAIFRLGVVLSLQGGVIQKTLPLFKMGLGGRLGSGKQAFPYIHIEDLARAYAFVIKANSKGIYNLVAPDEVSNYDFTKSLAKSLKRPAFCHVPSFILRNLLGEASTVLLNGQRVIPERLQKEGFVFNYLTLNEALHALT